MRELSSSSKKKPLGEEQTSERGASEGREKNASAQRGAEAVDG